jgi:S-formylglutathione hydrolase FrmB
MHPAIPATASSNLEFIREGLPGAAFSNLTAVHADGPIIATMAASLMNGWLPFAVALITIAALCYAVGWRSRRWRRVWLPVAVLVGMLSALVAYRVLDDSGITGEPAPRGLWPWTALSGFALTVAIVGWVGAGWRRRNASVFAASFCLLSTGLVINGWIGYFPTVGIAWSQLTAHPLPGQTDLAAAMQMRSTGATVDRGRLVQVTISADASGFRHRPEWVYLPPAWFDRTKAHTLPAVMMIGGEFNTPADWIRAGRATATLDTFAAAHDGNAPVVVFPDPSGSFTTDTECVNGQRGNAADHLLKDVVPYMSSTFGVSRDHWGVVGFSAGGTCALDLTVMHPDVIDTFVDIGGDARPNTGTTAQTVDRLFGGDEHAWSLFDPTTVMTRHGPYTGVSGLFQVPEGRSGESYRGSAQTMCTLARTQNIACSVTSVAGGHDWPSAAVAFQQALPWLADRLRTPATPIIVPP